MPHNQRTCASIAGHDSLSTSGTQPHPLFPPPSNTTVQPNKISVVTAHRCTRSIRIQPPLKDEDKRQVLCAGSAINQGSNHRVPNTPPTRLPTVHSLHPKPFTTYGFSATHKAPAPLAHLKVKVDDVRENEEWESEDAEQAQRREALGRGERAAKETCVHHESAQPHQRRHGVPLHDHTRHHYLGDDHRKSIERREERRRKKVRQFNQTRVFCIFF